MKTIIMELIELGDHFMSWHGFIIYCMGCVVGAVIYRTTCHKPTPSYEEQMKAAVDEYRKSLEEVPQ